MTYVAFPGIPPVEPTLDVLLPHHVEWLAASAISAEFAVAHGVRSVRTAADLGGAPARWAQLGTGVLFQWHDGERTEFQFHPDTTPLDDDGRPRKYLFRARTEGYKSTLSIVRPPEARCGLLLVEGSKQHLAAAEHAPIGWGVVGIPGCWGASDDGLPVDSLSIVEGRAVVVCLDADWTHNAHVWDSAERTQRQLLAAGADNVKWIKLPASGTSGLDDVLAAQRSDRTAYLKRLAEQAECENFPKSRRPKGKAKPGDLFDPFTGSLLAENAAKALVGRAPMLRTHERGFAVYEHGVYRVGAETDDAFRVAVAGLLGNQHRSGYVPTIRDSVGALVTEREPDYLPLPVLNTPNGLVHLETGQLIDHNPAWPSTWQTPVQWAPDASCPTYDQWIKDAIGDQVDVLEETVSAMLDPTATPGKAVILFGPSRSGKSTFLRLLTAVAGQGATSAVSLHALANDRFAAANVHGAVLNACAELSAIDVSDISTFKMLTGADKIMADRKFGQQFAFRNRALFAFSANRLPSVSETSRAYIERMMPIEFGKSFAGHENPAIETAMLAELPGIIQRWVRAWRARQARGSALAADPAVLERFRRDSNSVAKFIGECCQTLQPRDPNSATTATLHASYKFRMERDGLKPLGRTKFAENLRSMAPDVQEYADQQKRRVWNVGVLPPGQWAD